MKILIRYVVSIPIYTLAEIFHFDWLHFENGRVIPCRGFFIAE